MVMFVWANVESDDHTRRSGGNPTDARLEIVAVITRNSGPSLLVHKWRYLPITYL